MIYLIPLGLLATFVVFPIVFIIWTIRRIYDLRSDVETHKNEIELLNSRIFRLQNSLRKMQENGIEAVVAPKEDKFAGMEIAPAAVIIDDSGAASVMPDLKVSDVPLPAEKDTSDDTETVIKKKPEVSSKEKEVESGAVASPGSSDKNKPVPPFTESFVPSRKAPRTTDWSSSDMESLIGGNLMSKIGALLLVIGLALFLKYSLGAMGPWAKLAAGGILGALMLAWGVIQNRRDADDYLGIGLIGGGWACLYLTAFAAHGVEASQVVDDAFSGMLLMLIVAAGMILHSLRFSSETATGLAFLLAFISLFVSEVTLFSEIAAVLLTISMLILSFYYSWSQLAVAGLILTYSSMLGRLHWRSAPSELTALGKMYFVQSLLVVNWATFELIGMNFLKRSFGRDEEPTRALFVMNFAAYMIVSRLAWPVSTEVSLSILAGLVVLQYIVSGVLRGFWCQSPGENAVEQQRFFLGSLEDCLAISAVAACVWLWYVLPASAVVIGWALVGLLTIEIAFRAPWQLLRFTGHVIMTFCFFRVFMANMSADALTMGISYRVLTVVPLIALMIHLYFRTDVEIDWEAAPTGATRAFSPGYSYFAAILAAFLLRFEIGAGLTAPAWAIVAIFLTGAAQLFKNCHFGRQACLMGIGAVGYAFSTDLRNAGASELTSSPWFLGSVMVAALYVNRWMAHNEEVQANGSVLMIFDVFRREIFSLAGSISLAFLLYIEVSGGYLTLAWAAMGICLLVAGFFVRDRVLRLTGLSAAMICILKVFLYDARVLDAPLRILAFICLGGALILISWVYARFRERFQELL